MTQPAPAEGRGLVSLPPKSNDGGFTLIELLVVIAIIGILAAIATFSFTSLRGKSAESACKTDYKSIGLAQETYLTKTGSYPSDAQLRDGTSTILKSFPTNSGYAFSIPSSNTITITGISVKGTAVAGAGIIGCTKK